MLKDEEMMLRAATQRLSIPVAQGGRLLSSALRPPQRPLLSRGVRARGVAPISSVLQSQRRLLSDSTNALSHYKRERLLAKIGFGIHNSRRDARRLRLGALRSLASPRARTTHLTVLHRAYGVLEACLDAQVAALDKAPAAEGELEDFSSLQGVAAQFWKEHGDGLRRAPALAAALKADRPGIELGEEPDAAEHYWSPGTVQFARRVRAVEALNGDLLLGHILGAHIGDMVFDASIGFSADERRLGFTPSRNANAPPVQEVLAAIDSAAEELDDDPHAAVAIEASRSFRLRNQLYVEGTGLWRDAAIGGVRVLMGRVAEQARPSADAKPAN